jgi:threonine/homoserine/homoserine lactone efflux protein
VPDWPHLSLFVTTALVLVFVPGPNTLYVVARSVEQGRAAGVVSSLGVQTATLVHIAAAVAGLSSLVLSSALAFGVVKFAGALYLIALGLRVLSKRDCEPSHDVRRSPLRSVFAQGVLVNLLNPKTSLFFLAFLPQFVDPGRGAVAPQIVSLGAILLLLGLVSDTTYALSAGGARDLLGRDARVRRYQRVLSGTTYIGLGVAAALTGSRARG